MRERSWCATPHDTCSPLILLHIWQSEEDLQLKNELEMLVQRLKVCLAMYLRWIMFEIDDIGTQHRVVPARSGDPSNIN